MSWRLAILFQKSTAPAAKLPHVAETKYSSSPFLHVAIRTPIWSSGSFICEYGVGILGATLREISIKCGFTLSEKAILRGNRQHLAVTHRYILENIKRTV